MAPHMYRGKKSQASADLKLDVAQEQAVLQGEGRVSPATPRKQNNDQPNNQPNKTTISRKKHWQCRPNETKLQRNTPS